MKIAKKEEDRSIEEAQSDEIENKKEGEALMPSFVYHQGPGPDPPATLCVSPSTKLTQAEVQNDSLQRCRISFDQQTKRGADGKQ